MMKQSSVEKIIRFYKIWIFVLIALSIILPGYRAILFLVLWFSIMILMIYLLCSIIYLTRLKEELAQEKLREIRQERNDRKVKKTDKMKKRVEEENNA